MTSPSAIFVVGNSRSGTTMMGRILGNHSAVLMFRELHFFEELFVPGQSAPEIDESEAAKLAATLLSIQRSGYLAPREQARWQQEAEQIIASMPSRPLRPVDVYGAFLSSETERAGATIACEQTPRNLFYVDQIFAAFPDALVIEMVRDPRDVMLSKKHKWKRSYLGVSKRRIRSALLAWANYHPVLTARLWSSAIRSGGDLGGTRNLLRIRFEDFLEAPAEAVQEICARAGIEFQQSMLAVPQVGSSSAADTDEVGISGAAAGRWRKGGLTQTEIGLCEQLAGPEMAELGYVSSGAGRSPLVLAGYYLLLPVKLAAALLMNIGRLASVRAAIKRRLN